MGYISASSSTNSDLILDTVIAWQVEGCLNITDVNNDRELKKRSYGI